MSARGTDGAAACDRVLVTGGARSGKSTLAEQVVAALAGPDGRVDYLATGFPASGDDPEWAARVALHQQRRPDVWHTVETLDVAAELLRDTDVPVLVDCLGMWLTRTMDAAGVWEGGDDQPVREAVATLVDAVRRARRPVVLVTNEVGLGVVPGTASGRMFRDALGRLNMGVAAACGVVQLCVCGIPVAVKGSLDTLALHNPEGSLPGAVGDVVTRAEPRADGGQRG